MVNSSKAGIMVMANVLAIIIGRSSIQVKGLGPSIGAQSFGLPELIASTSLGHILGAGTILGLSSIGAL